MSSLPPELDFTADPSATPARMDVAMLFILAYLRRLESVQPEFLSVTADLKATGLARLDAVLSPIFVDAQEIEAQLTAIRAAWITGQPLTQLLADLRDQVTARLGNVDAQLLANLDAVTQRLAANADAVAAQLAANLEAVNAKLAALVFGTTQGKIPAIGAGDMLSPALIPVLQANPNIGPSPIDWSYGSLFFGNVNYVSKYGTSGWCLSLNGVANNIPVVAAPLRSYPKGVDLVISFIGWTSQGNATVTNDLYPDDLPESIFVLGTTPQRFSFVANSTSANMDNASLRFFWEGSTPGTTAFITDIKVEYGTRPTAYTRNDAGPGQFRANFPDRLLTTSAVWNDAQSVQLADAPTIGVDMRSFINAHVTLGGNRTLGAPSYVKPGQTGTIQFLQDGTGGRTLSFASGWSLGATVPTLSTSPGARDVLRYEVLHDGRVDAYLAKAR